MELYIIRHAQSTNNALADERDRVYDPPLTELGQRQAELLAEHLATGLNPELAMGASEEQTRVRSRHGYGIDRLYCSAMWRSIQTARPISQALGLKPEVWIDIHEHGGIFLDHGEEGGGIRGYPGKTRTEILAECPDYILPETITEEGWWRGAQEDWPTCHGRAIRVAEALRAQAAGTNDRVALITHGGFIDALMKALFNQLPGHDLFYDHYNTAITRIDFRPTRLRLRYLNRVSHLPPELVS